MSTYDVYMHLFENGTWRIYLKPVYENNIPKSGIFVREETDDYSHITVCKYDFTKATRVKLIYGKKRVCFTVIFEQCEEENLTILFAIDLPNTPFNLKNVLSWLYDSLHYDRFTTHEGQTTITIYFTNNKDSYYKTLNRSEKKDLPDLANDFSNNNLYSLDL